MLSHVKMLEVEIHSRCNRRCGWCPNKSIDRQSQINMHEYSYLRLLSDLAKGNFGSSNNGGIITYSRNNEPMADISLLKCRLSQAKLLLPKAKLITNTNGDYLNQSNLDELLIDELSIMDYDCKGMEWCIKRLEDLDATIDTVVGHHVYASRGKMKLVYCSDWPKHTLLEDRGGYFSAEHNVKLANKDMLWRENRTVRKIPCNDPIDYLVIDYNGNVVPCCCIRSDNPQHTPYILGNVQQESIVDIYHGVLANSFREKISDRKWPLSCLHCQKGIGRYVREKDPGIHFSQEVDKL